MHSTHAKEEKNVTLTLLSQAIKKGDLYAINEFSKGQLIDSFGKFNFSGLSGNALHYMAATSEADCYETTPRCYMHKQKKSALPAEAYKNIVLDLIQKGADLTDKDSFFKQFPLCTAIGFDNTGMALALIQADKKKETINTINDREIYRTTPLLLAVQRGNKEVAAALLEHGANPNLATKYQLSPLHWAAIMRDHEMMTLLVKAGANTDALDQNKRKPFEYYSYVMSLDELSDSQYFPIQSHFNHLGKDFVEHRLQIPISSDMMKLLNADRGKNPDSIQFAHHNSPAAEAIKMGLSDIANDLIEQGEDVQVPLAEGFTLLHYACLFKLEKTIQLLMSKGARTDVRNQYDASPLDYYLHEFLKLDTLLLYKKPLTNRCERENDKMVFIDIQHMLNYVKFFQTVSDNAPMIPNPKIISQLGGVHNQTRPSLKYCARMEALYRSYLEDDVRVILLGQGSFAQEFSQLLAKKIWELEPVYFHSKKDVSDKNQHEAAFELAKAEFFNKIASEKNQVVEEKEERKSLPVTLASAQLKHKLMAPPSSENKHHVELKNNITLLLRYMTDELTRRKHPNPHVALEELTRLALENKENLQKGSLSCMLKKLMEYSQAQPQDAKLILKEYFQSILPATKNSARVT